MSLWARVRDWIRPARVHGGGGLLWKSIEDAQQTEFFRWFQLVETSRAKGKGGRIVVRFRPSGEKFHDLVAVDAAVDRHIIMSIDLLLARSFIDDARDGIFARDIAKSLLRAAPPDADRAALSGMANEIEFAHDYPLIVGPGYRPPALPPHPSPGFQTYLGRRDSYEQAFSESRLRLEQIHDDVGRWLRISLRAK